MQRSYLRRQGRGVTYLSTGPKDHHLLVTLPLVADALGVGALSFPDPEQEISQPTRRRTPSLLAAATLLIEFLRPISLHERPWKAA